MEDLSLWVVERVAKMPRDHKFTIGDRLIEACLTVTTLLIDATYTRDKRWLGANRAKMQRGLGSRIQNAAPGPGW